MKSSIPAEQEDEILLIQKIDINTKHSTTYFDDDSDHCFSDTISFVSEII